MRPRAEKTELPAASLLKITGDRQRTQKFKEVFMFNNKNYNSGAFCMLIPLIDYI